MRALTAVVCVRRMFFWASSIFQSYLYLKGSRTSDSDVTRFDESWWMLLVMWVCDHVSPLWSKASLWVDFLHPLQVLLWELMCECWVWKTMFKIIKLTRTWQRDGAQRKRNIGHAPDRKKVSCWSLAGCCWGWNRESKFQKELSMKLLVGISVKLQRARSPFSECFLCVKWLLSPGCLQPLTPSPGRSAWTVFAPSSEGGGGRSQGPRPGPQSYRA